MPISGKLRAIADINIAVAALAINDALMRFALQSVPVSEAMALRGILTVALMGLIVMRIEPVPFQVCVRDRRVLALRTVAEVLCSVTFLLALVHMNLANLSAIQQALPLAATLCAAAILGEAIGRYRLFAIALGFGGVLLIVRPGTSEFTGWSLLALASMLASVVRDLATRRFSRSLPTALIAMMSAAGVTTLGLAGLAFESWHWPTGPELLSLASASVALSVGYIFTVRAMRRVDIGFIAPFRYIGLLWAIGLGWAFFGALPDGLALVGAATVVASGLFVCGREYHLHRRTRRAARAAGVPARRFPERRRALVDNPCDSPYTPHTRAKAASLKV